MFKGSFVGKTAGALFNNRTVAATKMPVFVAFCRWIATKERPVRQGETLTFEIAAGACRHREYELMFGAVSLMQRRYTRDEVESGRGACR
jgi:hypothetical protein